MLRTSGGPFDGWNRDVNSAGRNFLLHLDHEVSLHASDVGHDTPGREVGGDGTDHIRSRPHGDRHHDEVGPFYPCRKLTYLVYETKGNRLFQVGPIRIQANDAPGNPPPTGLGETATDQAYADHRHPLEDRFTVHSSPFTVR